MDEQEIDLSIGDVVQIGEYVVTVVDIEGTEVSFRVDSAALSDHATQEYPTRGIPPK